MIKLTIKILLFLSLVFGIAKAQPTLFVNGKEVPGLTSSFSAGRDYIPAQALAQSLNAVFAFDPNVQAVLFSYAGQLLSIQVFDNPSDAIAQSQALELGGQARAGPGAISFNGVIYLPLRAVAEALGATVSYSSEYQAVIVTFGRARLERATVQNRLDDGYERIILELSGRVAYETFYNETLNILQLRFEQTDTTLQQSLQGTLFAGATISPNAGFVDVRISLRPGITYDSFETSTSNGFHLIIDVLSANRLTTTPTPSTTAWRIVIDPGHGGEDVGLSFANLGTESQLTLQFSLRLAEALQTRGHEVLLTRDNDRNVPLAQRNQYGVGADMLVSIHAANNNPGFYNLYYLGDFRESGDLPLAIQQNASGELSNPNLDALRRSLLLSSVSDLSQAERNAQVFASNFTQLAQYRTATMTALPLTALESAGGRGLVLEFRPEDLLDADRLALMVASTLITVLSQNYGN